jgi:hypothetical protein
MLNKIKFFLNLVKFYKLFYYFENFDGTSEVKNSLIYTLFLLN